MTEPSVPPSAPDPATQARQEAYWRRNLRYLGGLLLVWSLVSFGFGVILAEPLNAFVLPGTEVPLGFWFAQQGSIFVFVILIFVYVGLMNRLDKEFEVDEQDTA